MFYVYILTSKIDASFYIGQTNDLAARLLRHNTGKENYTSRKLPWEILWSAEGESRSAAMKLERKLKNMKSRKGINEFISQNSGESSGSRGLGHEDARPFRPAFEPHHSPKTP
ncbi:hypothetical protein BH09BAC3_BH09BAC3_01720 [soil metagenome]